MTPLAGHVIDDVYFRFEVIAIESRVLFWVNLGSIQKQASKQLYFVENFQYQFVYEAVKTKLNKCKGLQYIPWNIHSFLCVIICNVVYICCRYNVIQSPISFRVTSLAQGQSYDCPSASEVTLKNMDTKPQLKERKTKLCAYSGIILGMGSANERWRYNVTWSLIGWHHIHNDPCIFYSMYCIWYSM